MKRLIMVCGAVLLLSLSAQAQESPRFDLFGGYSYIHFSISDSGGQVTSNLNGANGAVAFYPNRWLGIVGDFGGYKFSTLKQAGTSLSAEATVISYLFGPRIRFGNDRVNPFAQVLFGGAHAGDITSSNAGACSPSATPCTLSASENSFAMTAEGGVDIKVANHFSIRGQAGYLMTRFNGGSAQSERQNNARISVGVVIH